MRVFTCLHGSRGSRGKTVLIIFCQRDFTDVTDSMRSVFLSPRIARITRKICLISKISWQYKKLCVLCAFAWEKRYAQIRVIRGDLIINGFHGWNSCHAERLRVSTYHEYHEENQCNSFRFANEKNKRLSAYLCKKVNQRREVNYSVI